MGDALVPALVLMCTLCCVFWLFFSFFSLMFSFSFPPLSLPACPPCLYCMLQSVSWLDGWVPLPLPCLCQPGVLGRQSLIGISSLWSNQHLCNLSPSSLAGEDELGLLCSGPLCCCLQ